MPIGTPTQAVRLPLPLHKRRIMQKLRLETRMGIPKDDLPLIFERFYRADKSRTRETGGTGIGLALIRQITDLHQGTIAVQSEVGRETEFIVKLPKKIEVAEE
ncbi:hypothetical protein JCM17380_23470 [Desulfosporosinus burensis]